MESRPPKIRKNSENTPPPSFLPPKRKVYPKSDKNLPIRSKLKALHSFHLLIRMDDLHSEKIFSLVELSDKRLATGSFKSIVICSYNTKAKNWKKDITEPNAHESDVNYLCEFNPETLVSCSSDKTIKIWNITLENLTLVTTLTSHNSDITKVITLSNQRFASSSYDHSVIIWKNNPSNYEEIISLKEEGKVYSILQLKHKEILVTSSVHFLNPSIAFWSLNSYKRKFQLKGHYASEPNHMVELPDGNIAVSSDQDGYPIIIIDSNKCIVIEEILWDGIITLTSMPCVLDDFSIVYVKGKTVLQISSKTYDLITKIEGKEELDGYYGIISIEKGDFLIVPNGSKGISVIKPIYQ